MVLNVASVDDILTVTISLSNALWYKCCLLMCKVVVTFKSVDEILKYDHPMKVIE